MYGVYSFGGIMKNIILAVLLSFSAQALAADTYDIRIKDYKKTNSEVSRYKVSYEILKNGKVFCSPISEGPDQCIRTHEYELMTVLDDYWYAMDEIPEDYFLTTHFGSFQVKTFVYSYLGVKVLIADFGNDEIQSIEFPKVEPQRIRRKLISESKNADEQAYQQREIEFDRFKSAGNW